MKALVVGLGSAGRRHAENLVALGVEEVIGCSEWRQLKELNLAGRPSEVIHDYSQALDRNPDAVFIANPTSLHMSYLEAAVERGFHVYVEKPLAASCAGLSHIVEKVRHSPSIIAVGCQLRFNECLRRLKAQLLDSRIGRLLHVHVDMGEYLPNYHPDEDYRTGYAARRDLGGGVLATQIHDVNYLHWLLGLFQQVYAIGGKISQLEVNVEDSVSFLMKGESCPTTVHIDYLQQSSRRVLVVTGELGTLTWNYHLNSLKLIDTQGETELGPGGPLVRNEMFIAAVSDFLHCIRTHERPRTDFWEGLMDLAVVDAIRDSFTSNKMVPICYDVA